MLLSATLLFATGKQEPAAPAARADKAPAALPYKGAELRFAAIADQFADYTKVLA